MTVYRTDLTGPHDRLIAHLLPGDRLLLRWNPGEQIINADPDAPWIEIFNNDPIPRICQYGSEARLTQNTRVRQRPPIVAAARAVRRGGAVYVVNELRQETNRYGEAYGPLVPLPAGHVQIVGDLVDARGGV